MLAAILEYPLTLTVYRTISNEYLLCVCVYYSYHGKLIVRFDDTNPDKEKDEFEQAIIADLASLGVVADVVTHTSDSFGIIEQYARQLIREGLAYVDDTNQEQMQVGGVRDGCICTYVQCLYCSIYLCVI